MVQIDLAPQQLLDADRPPGIHADLVLFLPQPIEVNLGPGRLFAEFLQNLGNSVALTSALARFAGVARPLFGGALDLAGKFNVDGVGLAVLADDGVDEFPDLKERLTDQGVRHVGRRRQKRAALAGPFPGGEKPRQPQRARGTVARQEGQTLLEVRQQPLNRVAAPSALTLSVRFANVENQWNLWVYPSAPAEPGPANVLVTTTFDDAARARLRDGVMRSRRHLWIAVRPNGPHTPDRLDRLELRICDQVPDIAITVGLTVLAECQVHLALRDPACDPLASRDATQALRLAAANQQAVARHSLLARVRHWPGGREVRARDAIAVMIEESRPVAQALGSAVWLRPLERVLDRGNDAMRWLCAYRRGRSIRTILAEAGEGMEEDEVRSIRDFQKQLRTQRVDAVNSAM